MDQLLDLYGFLSVLLGAAELVARSVALGGVAAWLLLAGPLATRPALPGAARLPGLARAGVLWGAGATLLLILGGGTLQVAVLAATLEAPLGRALGADFVVAATAAAIAAVALLALAAPDPGPQRRAGLVVAALGLLAAGVATSHAMARTEGRALLLAATGLHQAGAALWLGGLPVLLAALRLPDATAAAAGRRYSALAAGGVGLILLGILGFWGAYLGGPAALYGTAYGAMATAKGVLFALLLGLGAANFIALHRLGAAPGTLRRVRRLVECELALGVAVLTLGASITSVPPAVDLPDDRVAWAEIVERFTPDWPRFASPDHADLAIPRLQARLDAEAAARADPTRPAAFTPGEGLLPPRNAFDIAWSEYNHHWAGLVVLLVGLAALLDASARVRVARHWPLLFLILAWSILIRSDPEVWPLGDIPLHDALRDPEVVQHKLAGLLVVGFAGTEWAVRLGRLTGRARFVFPLAMLAGGVLLMAHSHAVANAREALLIEISHLAIAILAVVGGCARWAELRGPPALAAPARWVWPAALLLIGGVLLIYREA